MRRTRLAVFGRRHPARLLTFGSASAISDNPRYYRTARLVQGCLPTGSGPREGPARSPRAGEIEIREAGMTTAGGLGFVGLGVMGQPMCRNLARKSGATVLAFDERSAPLAALAADGVQAAASVAELASRAEIVFLCLPGEPHVRAVCLGSGGLAALVHPGQMVVDMSTCPVALARELGETFASRGVSFADAPIARTAQAARDGTLSIMVGGEPALFERLRPLLACMGLGVAHCGGVGAGQAMKRMNNMVVAQTVVALAEALAVARARRRGPTRAVRDARQGVRRQLRPPQSRDEVTAARPSPDGGRLPHPLHPEGPVVRYRAGRARWRGARASGDHEAAARGHRSHGMERCVLHGGDPHHREALGHGVNTKERSWATSTSSTR